MDRLSIGDRVVDFSINQIQGFLKPSEAERAAAFELLVELSTRTTVASLAADEGLLREALASIYLVFDLTRESLRTHGADAARDHRDGNMSLGVIAVRVLNDILRPTLSKWHPRLEAHEALRPEKMGKAEWERHWAQHDECRAALNQLRSSVRAYIDTLGRISGAPGLAAAVLPLPRSRAVPQVMPEASLIDAADDPRTRMVRWFNLRQLFEICLAVRRGKGGKIQDPADPAPPTGSLETDGEFWFDYVADLGDAFDPTMAVAWQVGRAGISLPPSSVGEFPGPPASLPRAQLLVFGGDEVYPYASEKAYTQQLVLPYRVGWEGDDVDPRPTVVAIPGNHDWIGGIKAFTDTFLGKSFAAHWNTPQQQRWFAVKLPHGWWLWGIDTRLDNTVSDEQVEYFRSVDLHEGDRVILCTPVPLWTLRQKYEKDYRALRNVFDGMMADKQAKMPLFLSGDSHFFAHHTRADGLAEEDHITAGGGGAFLHPTHNLAEQLPYETGSVEFRLDARWPSAADSRALTPGWRQGFDSQFRSLVPVAALIYLVYAALVAWRLTVPDTPDAPERGWDALGWTVGAVPGWLLLALVVVGGMFVTRPNSDEALLARGTKKWGLVHGFLQAVLVVFVAASARWVLPGTESLWHFVAVPLLGAVLSLLLFAFMSRVINNRIRADDNTAFSRGHLTRFKHFLRIRIGPKGDLTVFAVGLDPVGEAWFDALKRRHPVPPFDRAGTPRLHYIWGKTIKGSPAIVSSAPSPAGGRSVPATKPLTVYVAWHPDDSHGKDIARQLLRLLQGDPHRPAAERIGIPVRYRTADSPSYAPPPLVPVHDGVRSVVAVVAGPHLLADEGWRTWCARVRSDVEAHSADARMVALATFAEALGAPEVGALSAMRLFDFDPAAQVRAAALSVLAATADLVTDTDKRVRIFVSHAKVDGAALAEALDQRIADAKLGSFLDSHAIVEGLHFDKVIEAELAAGCGAAITVVTDAYASREWCRIEALRAKQLGVPLVVLDAVSRGQERSLPYLGNVPVVRLGTDQTEAFDAALIALLCEVVRNRWFPGYVDRLAGTGSALLVLSRPPELLTVLHQLASRSGIAGIVYPEPPLGTDELDVLLSAVGPLVASWPGAQSLNFLTPTTVRRRAPHA